VTEKELLKLAFAPERWRPQEELDLAEWRAMTPQERMDIADHLRHETLAMWGDRASSDDAEDLEALERFRRVIGSQR
jgi:hypothetical protein